MNTDENRLGSGPDAGTPGADAGSTPGRDSGTPGRDSGTPRVDAGPPVRDAGSSCVTGDRCEGDTLVSCRGGVETRTDCQGMGTYCASNECQPWVCTPDTQECTGDLRGSIVCSPRGDGQTTMPCELGCNPATGACATTPPTCAGLPTINVGDTETFDLCSETDDETYVPAEGCTAGVRADVGDRVFVLTLEHATDLVIELSDADFSAAIDTVVYVRSTCDDPETQVACDDDVSCSESTIPGTSCSGVEVRQSRIRTRLGPGTYYIVADAFDYRTDRASFGCGTVRLRVYTP